MLENVQIRATKLVDGLSNLEYSERLKKIGIPTLVYRRLRGDLIEVYKHFNSYDKDCLSPSFKQRERTSRKHDFQLHWLRANDSVCGPQFNSFYYRISKRWNELPCNVVDSPNINIFKNRLDEHFKDEPMIYDHTTMLRSDLERLSF